MSKKRIGFSKRLPKPSAGDLVLLLVFYYLLDPFQLMSCRWSVPSNLLTLCSLTIITNPPLWYVNDSIVYTPRRQTSDAAWFQWHWHSSDRRREPVLTPRSGAILALCAEPHELTIVETRFSYSTLILSDAALVICSSAVVRYCCGPSKTCDTDSASYLLRHRGWIWESSGNSWREREICLSVHVGATEEVPETSSNPSVS